MHELPVFSSRSLGVLHSSTLVLATFGGEDHVWFEDQWMVAS
jgi:hypothetical protein